MGHGVSGSDCAHVVSNLQTLAGAKIDVNLAARSQLRIKIFSQQNSSTGLPRRGSKAVKSHRSVEGDRGLVNVRNKVIAGKNRVAAELDLCNRHFAAIIDHY